MLLLSPQTFFFLNKSKIYLISQLVIRSLKLMQCLFPTSVFVLINKNPRTHQLTIITASHTLNTFTIEMHRSGFSPDRFAFFLWGLICWFLRLVQFCRFADRASSFGSNRGWTIYNIIVKIIKASVPNFSRLSYSYTPKRSSQFTLNVHPFTVWKQCLLSALMHLINGKIAWFFSI